MGVVGEFLGTLRYAEQFEIGVDSAVEFVTNGAVAAPIGVARPEHARADIEVVALRKDPRIAAPDGSIFEMADVGAQVGMPVAPPMRNFRLHGDGERAVTTKPNGACHSSVGPVCTNED